MYILYIGWREFLIVLDEKSCSNIKTFHLWWSLLSFSWTVYLIMPWYCKENLGTVHYWSLNFFECWLNWFLLEKQKLSFHVVVLPRKVSEMHQQCPLHSSEHLPCPCPQCCLQSRTYNNQTCFTQHWGEGRVAHTCRWIVTFRELKCFNATRRTSKAHLLSQRPAF